MDFVNAITSGLRAFREAFLTHWIVGKNEDEEFEARKVKYAIDWASYEGTQYRPIHGWSMALKKQYRLYAHIRPVFNSSKRIADFYKANVWRGPLDKQAREVGAMPITVLAPTNETIRASIAKINVDSNMSMLKEVVPLWGAVFGDVGLKVVDDPERGIVFIEKIIPSKIKDFTKDSRGFIKSYTLEENVIFEGTSVKYTEKASRVDEGVLFETFKNDSPFGWDGNPASWVEEYPFVPFLHVVHQDVGMKFGWSETHGARAKMMELDDVASKANDHLRKMVDPIWLFNFKKPSTEKVIKSQKPNDTTEGRSIDDSKPVGRDELPGLYVPEANAKAQALVTTLNLADVLAAVDKLKKEIESDFPELQLDLWDDSDTASGKALHIAREKVEAKIISIRAAYDTAMVRALQMAIYIATFRKYKGYGDHLVTDYEQGKLDFYITDRPVFPQNALDFSEVKKRIWEAVVKAAAQGFEPATVLQDFGYTESQIAKMDLTIALQQASSDTQGNSSGGA